jgi:hypothetical protein
METELKEVEGSLVQCVRRILNLNGRCRNLKTYRIKVKNIKCLIAELDYVITQFEEAEKALEEGEE